MITVVSVTNWASLFNFNSDMKTDKCLPICHLPVCRLQPALTFAHRAVLLSCSPLDRTKKANAVEEIYTAAALYPCIAFPANYAFVLQPPVQVHALELVWTLSRPVIFATPLKQLPSVSR